MKLIRSATITKLVSKKIIIPLVYMYLNGLRFNKVNSIQYWNIMQVMYKINVLQVKIYSQIILLFIFIFTTIFAHPPALNEQETHSHPHTQNEIDLINDLDKFNDLNPQVSNPSNNINSKPNQDKNELKSIDDDFRFINDDFDYGNDEYKLQKIQINRDDLDITKEYEDFLNSFYKETTLIGNKTSSSKIQTNKNLVRLHGMVNNLESEKLSLKKKIETLEKQIQSGTTADERADSLEFETQLLNQRIETLEKQIQSGINEQSYETLQEDFDSLEEIPKSNRKTANSSNRSGFGISALMGLTLPIMQEGFSVGPNLGIRLHTPVSFNLADMEMKVGTDIYFSMMSPKDHHIYYPGQGKRWYTLINILGNVSISPFDQMNNQYLSSIEIISGLGFTVASIGTDQKIALSIPIDLIYYLPIDLSGFKIGLNLLSQITIGHPTSNKTTSVINAGLVIKTPLQF